MVPMMDVCGTSTAMALGYAICALQAKMVLFTPYSGRRQTYVFEFVIQWTAAPDAARPRMHVYTCGNIGLPMAAHIICSSCGGLLNIEHHLDIHCTVYMRK